MIIFYNLYSRNNIRLKSTFYDHVIKYFVMILLGFNKIGRRRLYRNVLTTTVISNDPIQRYSNNQ
jgi:hypothetical protein